MPTQFFSKLSQNLIELLKDDEYYDITIEVGEDPNHNISGNLELLATADQLQLQELVDYLQKYLIENKSVWIKENFELTHRICFQSNNLLELQKCCTEIMANSPEQVFTSLDFTSLPDKSLISLIKRDDLQMKEIEVWEYILKWGLAKNATIVSDPDTWTDEDFETMKNTLQHCIPLIRFYSLLPKEFLCKVLPYKKLFNQQLYKNLLSSYMNPDSEPNDDNILLPRNIKTNLVLDTKIVNLNIISTISRWINNMDYNNKFSYLRELYFPYEFKLLLRGSRDGFTPKKFHELCNRKVATITFIKVKETEEILGGYNPLVWNHVGFYYQTKYSFIFSFKNKRTLKDGILSNVENVYHAVDNRFQNYGPTFGEDLLMWAENDSNDYEHILIKKKDYEKKIRDEGEFSMEDYEVFQIIKRLKHLLRIM
ncbi:hypothetical protein RclHR1_02240022 [Rhizophagus clarus]|uniref:TLDc domain-containing protein n=1 Tax=Rhizophagus clarus TaxID=94130 RepID=A0A2Z6QV67_9GLOM|nr:hypothetical protein RclHR1_02240022 [Rhizophagus clarus]GES90378.1 hypothetical protein GLOIN_2v1762239 [Rhizophagus clarus]